jgi:putative tricarboxylic transport membrane protein
MMDRLLGGALAVAALLLYFIVIPGEIGVPKLAVGGGVGGVAASPLFFPRLTAGLIGLLGVFLLVRGHSRARSLADGEGFPFNGAEATRVGGSAAILVVYALLLEPVGYLVVTPLALIALCVFLGFRQWIVTLVTAVVFAAVVYFGFRYGMKILLPEGVLG